MTKANLWQQEILDEVTALLLPHNDLAIIPPDVQDQIDYYNRAIKWHGLKLKLTHYDDGVGCGWIIAFEGV